MTVKQMIKCLARLELVGLPFQPDFTDKDTIAIWYELLKHIPLEDFKRALSWCAGNCKRFPVPAEIKSAANPTNSDQAWVEVIEQIYQCCGLPDAKPVFSSVVIAKVVVMMGGLESIWMDLPYHPSLKREFDRLYNQLLLSGMGGHQVKTEEIKQVEDKNVSQ